MCQLFGFSYNGVNPDFSDKFMEFRSRGKHNPHAWGVALWTDTAHGPLVIRDPHPANTSRAAALVASLEARTLIAHVRYGTAAPLNSVVNAHPFVANIDGKDWAFAHNGFLRGVEETAGFAEYYAPVGTTDSEQFFAVLVDYLHNGENHATAVASATKRYAKSGKLNFLLSNVEEFYFFSNHSGLYYKATKNAVYVATVPVGNRTNWFPATPGTLYVVENGKIIAKVVVENGATYVPKKRDVANTTGYIQNSIKFDRVRIRPDLTEEEWSNLMGFIEERKGTAGLKRMPVLI